MEETRELQDLSYDSSNQAPERGLEKRSHKTFKEDKHVQDPSSPFMVVSKDP